MQDSHTGSGSILLIIDALRPNMLGPYGNTWFDTPSLNQFAAEAIVYEQCFADTPDPVRGLTGLMTGRHLFQTQENNVSIVDIVDESVPTVLVTTDIHCLPDVYDQFDKVVEVELAAADGLAPEFDSTQLATFFAAAIQEIADTETDSFIVLYCGSLATTWDAPYSIRERLADEDDPDPSQNHQPVSQQFNESDDPDQLLDCQIAYGSQIVVLDQLLQFFLDQVAENAATRNSLIALTSLRGYPMGEHGVIGFYRNQLFNESLHVPLMIRFPMETEREFYQGRSQLLVQPGSLFELLTRWFGVEQACSFPSLNIDSLVPDFANSVILSGVKAEDFESCSIQTQSWKLIVGPAKQLFVRPDDVWDYNDVADLCVDLAAELETQLAAARKQIESGQRPQLELSNELAFGIE